MGPELFCPAEGPLRRQWHGDISMLKGGESTGITFLTWVSSLIETLSHSNTSANAEINPERTLNGSRIRRWTTLQARLATPAFLHASDG